MSDEDESTYRETAQRRAAERRQASWQRLYNARSVAEEAAEILRERFDADHVCLFGSAGRGEPIGSHGDVDLGVRGIPPDEFYTAVAKCQELHGELDVDLVDLERCEDSLRERILTEGVEL